MNCPLLLKYPDEFISNTKVARNSSTNPDTPPTRVSDVHDTSGMNLPPPDHLSGNHPEPVKLPVKFCFVRNVKHCVSSPLAYRISMYCICIAIIVVYLLFLPPLFLSMDVATAADASPFVRLHRRRPCTPTVGLPGK